jgi:Ubiquitin-conjugating enzyme
LATPTTRREVDIAHVQALAAASAGRVQVLAVPSPGRPRFELGLNVRTAASARYPEQAQAHCKLTIELDARHPFMPPVATLHTPVFHPNVFESGVVCMGAKWLPSEGMDLFVRRVLRLLAFDPLLVNLRSVANHSALGWYQRTLRQQPQAFPSDPAALRVGEPGAGSQPTITPAAGRVVVRCPQCHTGLRLPAGRSGVVACPGCQREFEAQT